MEKNVVYQIEASREIKTPGRGRPKVLDRALKSKLGVLRVSVVKFEVYGYISLAETQDH